MLVAIMGITTSGLNLSFGLAGELALGQAAVFASGAYTTAYLSTHGHTDLVLCLVASAVVAVVVGLIAGGPGLRLGGFTLAMASFFLVLLIPSVIELFGETLGGPDGLSGIPLPSVFGTDLGTDGLYAAIVVVGGIWLFLFRNIVKSRQGRILVTMRESPVLAASCGAHPFQMKLRSYAIAGIPAGLGGSLFVFLNAFVSPTSFGFDLVILLLAMSVIGGSQSVLGPVVGAFLLTYLPERVSVFQDYTLVAYGAMLVLIGVLLPRGAVGLLSGLWKRAVASRRSSSADEANPGALTLPPIDGRELHLRDVAVSFGGVRALDGVSFSARPGEITALIGPNGSGKTTLLNVVSGYLRRDSGGDITLDGKAIHGLRPDRIRRMGVGRTFQTPLIPRDLTVRETLMVGAYGDSRSGFFSAALRLPGYLKAERREREAADELVEAFGLAGRADMPAKDLSLGTRRIVELARALMGRPQVVLLDEIASGLDRDEVQELVEALHLLKRSGATVVLVEHNFSLVRAVADTVVCLAGGRLLAQGTPDEIASHPDVLEKYLGAGAGISGTDLGAHLDPADETSPVRTGPAQQGGAS
ncbi:branched-chain amino acid ABC transporter ATP-binding protein/permease [Dactylosporangium sp. AC04546]|uniref:branched-chain amino acid ABC transporter ATP-binding protein/permease n=1 Tax=Dactylosporangium sp. AC04546 TaxID=2862460 RepID=UPI001EE022E5|nr:branched-chain amino acid ABC transporter ATP-binding protein/permease [Dactylosporangium sp. AC04546]WVK86833.1 branched-chain amino acid ABC transporter ATP-binding protein/permease [Dactylosporangium sp. AC04546]